jgi:hypothetical protein
LYSSIQRAIDARASSKLRYSAVHTSSSFKLRWNRSIAAAFRVLMRRAPMGDAEPAQRFQEARRSELRSVIRRQPPNSVLRVHWAGDRKHEALQHPLWLYYRFTESARIFAEILRSVAPDRLRKWELCIVFRVGSDEDLRRYIFVVLRGEPMV